MHAHTNVRANTHIQTHTHTHARTRIQARRPHDVRLIVMSATLEASKFVSYLPGCKAALIHGRAFPVQLHFTVRVPPSPSNWCTSPCLR